MFAFDHFLRFGFEQGGGNGDGFVRPGAAGLAFDFIQKLFEHVPAAQDQFNDRGVNGQLALAGQVQQGFHYVGEPVDGNQIQKPRAPFESVKRAEDGVEHFGVGRRIFEHEHTLFDVVQMFAGFGDEFAQQVRVFRQVQVQGRLFGGQAEVGDVLGGGGRRRFGGGRSGGNRGGWRWRWGGIRSGRQCLHPGQRSLQPGDVGGGERLAGFHDAHGAFPSLGTQGGQGGQSRMCPRFVAQIAEQIEDRELTLCAACPGGLNFGLQMPGQL